MFESIVTVVVLGLAFVLGFLLGCHLTLKSIRQDGVDLFFDGNAWKIKE